MTHTGDATPLNSFKELKDVVAKESARTSALFISFVAFGAYLIIVFSSLDHKAILEQSLLHLPIINADLPVLWFSVVGALIFVGFHFYILMQYNLLNALIAEYDKSSVKDHEESFRPVDNLLFFHMVGGRGTLGLGFAERAVRIIPTLILVVSPLALLLEYPNYNASFSRRMAH